MIIDNDYHILFYNLYADQKDISTINTLIKLGLGHILWRGHYHIKKPALRHEYMLLLYSLCIANASQLRDASHAEDTQKNCQVLADDMNETTYNVISNTLPYTKDFQTVWTCLHHILEQRGKSKYVPADEPK